MTEVKGLRRTKWQLQNIRGDIKYGMGNIVNSIPVTIGWLCGVVRCKVGTGNTSTGALCKVYGCLATVLYA